MVGIICNLVVGQFRCDERTIQTTYYAVTSLRKGNSIYNTYLQ